MEQKNSRKFLVLKVIEFEAGSKNSHNLEHYICHWQSICYQATLNFKITLKEV